MQDHLTSAYTTQALESLKELLQSHQALLWVDPTTNSLAVKHLQQPPLKEEEDQTVTV